MTTPLRGSLRQLLARNLRFLLEQKDLSQRAAAAAGKVDAKTFNNMVMARFDPRLAQVERVAAALDVEPWQLLAIDMAKSSAPPKDALRLLDLFMKASGDGRAAILQVAAVVSQTQ